MLLAAMLIVLPGCSLVDHLLARLLEPRASAVIDVPAVTTTAQVFECTRSAVAVMRGTRGWHDPDVTRTDSALGVIETGPYAQPNRVGFRTRTVFVPEVRLVFLRVKGGGIYYTDLGVERTVLDLEGRLRACLAVPEHARAPLLTPMPHYNAFARQPSRWNRRKGHG